MAGINNRRFIDCSSRLPGVVVTGKPTGIVFEKGGGGAAENALLDSKTPLVRGQPGQAALDGR
jgi:hypothetical protein